MIVLMTAAGVGLGAILGSLVKAIADRSLVNKSFWGRSYCPKCKQKLHWYDLLPIFSYLLLGGKCRYCKDKIPLEYLLVEVVMGILVGFLFWQSSGRLQVTGYRLQLISSFQFLIPLLDLFYKTFLISVLATLFLTDLKEMLIPDRVSLPAIVISAIYLLVITIYKVGYLYYSLGQTFLGQKLLPPYSDYFQRHAIITAQPFFGSILSAILIAGFFLILIFITSGKGMGGGDVKLGALMGLGLGFPNALLALVLGFLSGAIISFALIILGKKKLSSHIPFGPFLVFGSLITLLWGTQIVDWYLNLRIT